MRILLINESARSHTGGIHRMVVESCDLLQRAGHEVALAYSDGGKSEVACPTFPFPPDDDRTVFHEHMTRITEAFRPEVAQFHSLGNLWLDSVVADLVPTCRFIHDQTPICSSGDRMARDFSPCHRPHGLACLFWHYAQGCGGRNPLNNLRRWQWVQRMQASKDCRSMRFQVASEFMLRGLQENSWDESRIDVVPLFAVAPTQTLPTEPGNILVASRLVRSKGVQVLLEALSGLNSIPWKLVIAGTGPERSRLESFVSASGLSERVNFVGEVSPAELEPHYCRSQLVVTPTLRPEPFGLIGPEAMAHGKPVIAFEGGATEEWLTDNETGIVVREHSASALRTAITSLLENRLRSETLGARAREKAAFYRPDAYLARLLTSFGKCISTYTQHTTPTGS